MKINNIPRKIKKLIDVALEDTPVILINGPRQSGKTTLAKQYIEKYQYYTLDDDNTLNTAKQDPIGFISQIECGIIDEIQRAPELLRAIKLSVDQNRTPGRFILAGSANLLLLPQLGDSLAGRMETFTLYPLSLAELNKTKSSLLQCIHTQTWPKNTIKKTDCITQALIGGFPEMQLRKDFSRRRAWAKSYIKSIVERDIKDISNIEKLYEMTRLLDVLSEHSGKITNFNKMSGQINLDAKTAQNYLSILETLFLVKTLPPWHRNSLNRLLKSPKMHFVDSGLLAANLSITPEKIKANKTCAGAVLETWVFGELLKMIDNLEEDWSIYHYRDRDQVEIDFILEKTDNQIIGIEVKAGQTIFPQDFRGLKKLSGQVGTDWLGGVVLYDGDQCLPFGDKMWAVPLSLLGK